MFEKQLSHHRARKRKQRRPPESNPLCGHLISSTDIKALALTSNCIASCELSSLSSLPFPPCSLPPHSFHLIMLSKGMAYFLLPLPKVSVPLPNLCVQIAIAIDIDI